MRRSPVIHLVLGSLVIALSGLGGQLSRLSRLQSAPTLDPRARPTWTMTEDAYKPTRIIVKARGGELVRKLLGELLGSGPIGGMSPREQSGAIRTFAHLAGLGVVEFPSSTVADLALAQLRRDPRIEYAEYDTLWHVDTLPADRPNDARFAEQWGLENTGQQIGAQPAGTAGVDIDARTAWAITQGSDDVIVAVIDSGIDVHHEDLARNLWRNEKEIPGNGRDDDGNGIVDDVNGFNAIDRSGDLTDDIGHGTHVAGIIGAVGGNDVGVTGINWSTRIMSLKFLGAEGGGTTSDAIACIEYVAEMSDRGENIRVVNCSWGGTERSRALEDAIGQASARGILFVCASGNDGVNTDQVPHFPSCYSSEAIVSVAALAPDDSIASFSNWGTQSVDIAAPGVEILSTLPDGRYGFASGTSMAAPFVTGVAALVVSGAPNLKLAGLRERLLKHATSVPQFDGKLASGMRLNGAGAVTAGAGS